MTRRRTETNACRVKWNCDCAECKAAHALYEAMRREKKGAERRARELRSAPLIFDYQLRFGRRLVLPRLAQELEAAGSAGPEASGSQHGIRDTPR